jgi:hypothetical protein
MYVRVSFGKFDTTRASEVTAATSQITAAVRCLPGFVRYYQGLDAVAGSLVSITFWSDETSANYPRTALDEVAHTIRDLGIELGPANILPVIHENST